MLRFCAALLFVATLLVLATFTGMTTTIRAQPLPPAPVETYWQGLFAPPGIISPQIILDMDCVSENMCYIGGASNGQGAGVFKFDGKINGALTEMPMPNRSAFVFQIKAGGTEANPTGVFTSIDLFITLSHGLQYLANQGTEWLASLMPLEFIWTSQSLTTLNSNTYIALGGGITNDIVYSDDGGKEFGSENINWKNDGYYNCSYAQAIATPSKSAWFMTWSATNPKNNAGSSSSGGSSFAKGGDLHHATTSDAHPDEKYFNPKTEVVIGTKLFGRQLIIQNKVDGTSRVHTKTIRQFHNDLKIQEEQAKKVQNTPQNCTSIYKGAILMSNDEGKTWREVFRMPEVAIDFIQCFPNSMHCTAIGFNAEQTVTITTQNGADWRVAYRAVPTHTSANIVQQVGYASATEIWVGGSAETQAAAQGKFWFSNDSGVTFYPFAQEIPEVEVITSIVFTPEGTGFASGLTMFKTSQIMRYSKQKDYGFFSQKQCPKINPKNVSCDLFCEDISFPQGFCLKAQGGSAKAFCSADGSSITQYIYQTTSCEGAYQTSVQPANKCLNGTQNYFESICAQPPKGRKATQRDWFNF